MSSNTESMRKPPFLFNPYTGTPRHPSDIQSDPRGLLIIDHDERLYEAQAEPAQQPASKPEVIWMVRIPESRRGIKSDIAFYYKHSDMPQGHIDCDDEVIKFTRCDTSKQASEPAQPVAWRYREYDAEEQAHSEVWLLTRDKFVIDVARRYNAIIEGLYASPPNLRAAVEAMREAAAKVCADRGISHIYGPFWNSRKAEEAEDCAKEIRALDIDTVIAQVEK